LFSLKKKSLEKCHVKISEEKKIVCSELPKISILPKEIGGILGINPKGQRLFFLQKSHSKLSFL